MDKDGKPQSEVNTTIDIVSIRKEVRSVTSWCRNHRELLNYVPHASTINGQVASVYGNAVANAAANQIVVIFEAPKMTLNAAM
jgi:hypothetical protein